MLQAHGVGHIHGEISERNETIANIVVKLPAVVMEVTLVALAAGPESALTTTTKSTVTTEKDQLNVVRRKNTKKLTSLLSLLG